MSEGEDEGDGDEEMEAIIHGYDEDEMDEDDDSDDIDAEAELIDDDGEDDGNREMTWHLEDIEEDSSIIRGGSVNADEREDQSPGIRAADIPYDEEVNKSFYELDLPFTHAHMIGR
jgi:E3 ubiquitin-protein ligase HUWE1